MDQKCIECDYETPLYIYHLSRFGKVDPNEPPPALAVDAATMHLQAQLAAQNICVASSHLLDLIRTLRMSALLMDEGAIKEEELAEIDEADRATQEAVSESLQIECQLYGNISN